MKKTRVLKNKQPKSLSVLLDKEDAKDKIRIQNFFIKKFDINRAEFDLNKDTILLTTKQYKKLKNFSLQTNQKEDITFYLGYKWFYNVKLSIRKNIFVPQSDTEGLIDIFLEEFKNNKRKTINILEIGTGSGAISIAISKNKENVFIDSIDISKKAINLATFNAIQNGQLHKINFFKFNFLKGNIDKKYDVIISNPPYIDVKDSNVEDWVKKNQPSNAIYAKHDGVDFYNRIFETADKLLNPKGIIFLEIGFKQKEVLEKIIPKYFKSFYFKNDLNKHYRYLILKK